jgi:hypothetical protein
MRPFDGSSRVTVHDRSNRSSKVIPPYWHRLSRTAAFGIFVCALVARGQVAPTASPIADLDAHYTTVSSAPANTSNHLIPLAVDAASGRDYIDVTVSNPAAKVSLMLPNSTEITALNAVANGYAFTSVSSADAAKADFPSPLAVIGQHTLIQIASTAVAGAYSVKIDTTGIGTATQVVVMYFSGSQIRFGAKANGSTYSIGQNAVISGILVNDTAAVNGATVSASVRVVRDVSAQVTIGNYQFVSQANGTDGYTRYTYSMRATNGSATALTGVHATGKYPGGSFDVGELVQFGDIGGSTFANGLDTFTVAIPTGTGFSTGLLQWKVYAASPATNVTLTDSGPYDGQSGDGIYSGAFTTAEAGQHLVTLSASGTFGGASF